MDILIAGSAQPGRAEKHRAIDFTGLRTEVILLAGKLLGVLRRSGHRLFDRVGSGLREFDDNLWDGGDEA